MTGPSARHAPAAALLAGLLTGCGGGQPAADQATSSSAPPSTAAAGAAGIAPGAAAGPSWTDAVALAAAIASTHYVPAIQGGGPYEIVDPRGGGRVEVGGPDLQEDGQGRPRAWPTGPGEGYVLATARARSGEAVEILYAVRWDGGMRRMDGGQGGFSVTGAEIQRLGGDSPRFRFEQDGAYWRRVAQP